MKRPGFILLNNAATRWRGAVTFALALGVVAVATSHAAELRLRTKAAPVASLVRLGDVAQVVDPDPATVKSLSEMELFPAPAAGAKRYLAVRELQDLLLLRGVNLADHRFSGSSVVELATPRNSPAVAAVAKLPGKIAEKQATARLRSPVEDYLREARKTAEPLEVEIVVTPELAVRVLASDRIEITGGPTPGGPAPGGAAAWLGDLKLGVLLGTETEPRPLEVHVKLAATVLVAAHALTKGEIVRADDVRSEPAEKYGDTESLTLAQIAGRETTRPITAGQPFAAEALRAPIQVRRGDAVTITARSAGLFVRTTARAKEDGAVGELVTVESLLNKQSFFARVTGPQQAEVFAQSVQTQVEEPQMPAQPRRTARSARRPERFAARETHAAGTRSAAAGRSLESPAVQAAVLRSNP